MGFYRLRHPDGTPCQGTRCAWQGDGGHVTQPVKTCCPSCGSSSRLFDIDRVTRMQQFVVQADGSANYGPEDDLITDETTTVGVYCRACDWSVTWGEKATPDESDLGRHLVTPEEFESSREANE